MEPGWGVSVVAHEIAERIGLHGWDLLIGCLSTRDAIGTDGLFEVDATAKAVEAFSRSMGVEVVVAQTSPYFELLPEIAAEFPTIAFEHGDPSPHFFDEDAEERQRVRQNKITNVYPQVSRVLAISEFIRHDIEWPTAALLPNGCDHVVDLGPKDPLSLAERRGQPLRVGTLMRLGEGESRYKGVDIFVDLVGRFRGGEDAEFTIMGRGDEAHGEYWASLGVEVHLNATDAERSAYLRGLDVFVSPSQWEGFNLPLVEAQAMGTVGVAFDVAAHPETTPCLAENLDEMQHILCVWGRDRELLSEASVEAYHFARAKFSWERTAKLFAKHLDEVATQRGLV